ncbi:YbfB/YjiJ family MFS transporter [Paraburkholderia tagetis]|uniref:YbfB/YjiJ family MFS transporter n=1 Tax=Paraburkholderia tagetis TaxID=2913261 RepID=A0A9X1UNC2_9BURK|nr:YbfB/YjiJ family MFS transporter [Paraburkholderia tagetis]MCG5078608.1 YbfB/YjiJ family MFS transporter [Paraburkholderia tagetis]
MDLNVSNRPAGSQKATSTMGAHGSGPREVLHTADTAFRSERGVRRDRNSLPLLFLAARLSLGSAIALGLVRFSYALLLPVMKVDLGWGFAQAGAMNTANAAGYLAGAVVFPVLARRHSPSTLFVSGAYVTIVLMAMCGLVSGTPLLLAQRLVAGIGSAFIFISGGVLAARLATAAPRRGGLILGLYYGGTGYGIVLSSILVPATMHSVPHGWQPAWFALAAACAICTLLARGAARSIDAAGAPTASAPGGAIRQRTTWWRYGFALGGYGLFGVGYIGYMTFIVALLRSEGMSQSVVCAFYIALGIATIGSARLWSGFLDRMRGGMALATFNALLALATLMPAVLAQPVAAAVSGVIFGATFLSAVASTTAFVRHNLPSDEWTRGISAFTIVFALGQIVGPVAIGWVSDNASLTRGLVYSSAVLLVGALLAACQRPLDRQA